MPKESDALLDWWSNVSRPILDQAFEDFRSAGLKLTPDDAMSLIGAAFAQAQNAAEQLEPKKGDAPDIRPAGVLACMRVTHHYAVDLFYRTYYEAGETRGRGRPRLSPEHLDKVLTFRRQGVSYGKIAAKLGQTLEATRKQAKQVERLWEEKTREVYELARKLNMVAD
jgi:hypothetical protein